MKNYRFLQMAVIAILLVTAVGCTAIREGSGYYEDEPTSCGTYFGGPRNYGGRNVIVVERDPYTGRYYQVSPYDTYGGGYYSNPYPNYYRGYDRGYSRGYNNNNSYRNYNNGSVQQQQPTQQQTEERRAEQNNARDQILGRKRN